MKTISPQTIELIESLSPDDAPLVIPFLHNDRLRVRTSAVHALGGIGSNVHREAVITALSDRVFTKPTPCQVEQFESLLEPANIDASLRTRLRALVPHLKARSL